MRRRRNQPQTQQTFRELLATIEWDADAVRFLTQHGPMWLILCIVAGVTLGALALGGILGIAIATYGYSAEMRRH